MEHNDLKNNKFVKKTVLISVLFLIAIIAFTIVFVKTWPSRTINRIDKYILAEEYEKAEEFIKKYEAKENIELSEQSKKCSYYIVLDEIKNGNTDEARYRLGSLGDYNDSKVLLLECDYIDAGYMMEEGALEEAYRLYASLQEYKDSADKMLEARYQLAHNLYTNGEIAKAMEFFLSLENYKDAEENADKLAMEMTGAATIEEANKILDGLNFSEMQKVAELTEARGELPEGVLAIGAHHTVGLQSDGTVVSTGLNAENQCDVSGWSNIVAIDAGAYHTVGLKSDGTVVAAGRNEEGQCDVEQWENVVQIAAGAYNTYGLLKDGTIVSAGFIENSSMANVKNIRQIGAGAYAFVCIDKEGIILSSHPSMNISDLGAVAADVSTGYMTALMADGTVASTAENMPEWKDIISINAGSNMILAVNKEHKIYACFFDERDMILLDDYTDVLEIAAGGAHSVILTSDGKVHAFGSNQYGECECEEWNLLSE